MMPLLKGIHDGQELFVMNLIVNLGRRKTYENENQLDEEDYFLWVVRIRHIMQSQRCPFPKQKVWKGLHESKVGQS
jgi:hypothetical protein